MVQQKCIVVKAGFLKLYSCGSLSDEQMYQVTETFRTLLLYLGLWPNRTENNVYSLHALFECDEVELSSLDVCGYTWFSLYVHSKVIREI